jgi:hypothetical protein
VATIVALCSAKGSPGTTTTALALTYAWPRDVLLVEADVSAGSAILAGHLNGREAHERGLLGIGLAHRRHGRITEDDVWRQSLELTSGRFLLPGLWDPVQAAQLTATWPGLAKTLRELADVDVIIDFGRLGTAFDAGPLLPYCDLVLAVGRCTLADAYALTRRIPALGSILQPHALRLVTVGPKDPYPPSELARKLEIPLLCALPWDPAGAGVYSHGRPGHRRRSQASLDPAAAEAAAHLLTTARSTTVADAGARR